MTTARVRLNLYERGIAEALAADFGYGKEEARLLVAEYIQVVRKLGGYDTCSDHAERLHAARRNGYRPEDWLKRIEDLRRDKLKDKNVTADDSRAYA